MLLFHINVTLQIKLTMLVLESCFTCKTAGMAALHMSCELHCNCIDYSYNEYNSFDFVVL